MTRKKPTSPAGLAGFFAAHEAAEEAAARRLDTREPMQRKANEKGARLIIALFKLAQRLPPEDAELIKQAVDMLAVPPGSLPLAKKLYDDERAIGAPETPEGGL